MRRGCTRLGERVPPTVIDWMETEQTVAPEGLEEVEGQVEGRPQWCDLSSLSEQKLMKLLELCGVRKTCTHTSQL